jgi:hypothetical protein
LKVLSQTLTLPPNPLILSNAEENHNPILVLENLIDLKERNLVALDKAQTNQGDKLQKRET